MALQDEIAARQTDVKTDSYSMSIGEIINLYRSREIDIHPEFQRFYRWTLEQKSRLIESILLGIPLPPIFVAQRKDGVWDVIDGLQRLSSIFEFTGDLRDDNDNPKPPLRLASSPECYDYLPSLSGKMWECDNPQESLTSAERLYIKRSKLGIIILLKGSDPRTKLALFQRLNTGGSQLSDQEIRNCLIIMVNSEFYRWLRTLAAYQPFIDTLSITDRAFDEQYDIELIVRFLVFRTVSQDVIRNIGDLTRFLNLRIIEMAQDQGFDLHKEERVFHWVFDLLAHAAGSDVFRRFRDGRYIGGFLVSAFEIIAIGLAYHYDRVAEVAAPESIRRLIQDLWRREDFARLAAGVRASQRIPQTLPLGRELFAELVR
jgi:hypothetical protein